MSNENRDESNGQFSPEEPKFGIAGLEADAGYKKLPSEEHSDDAEELTVAEAAERVLSSTPESEIVTHGGLPDDIAISLDEAAKISSDRRAADEAQAALEADEKDRQEVDRLRGENAETLEANDAAKARPVTADSADEIDVQKVLENPKIKAAIDQQLNETEHVRQQYTASLDAATAIAQATFVSQFPELASLPEDQRPQAIAALQQHYPERFARLLAAVENANQLTEAQKAARENESREKLQSFKAYAQREDERFAEMIKGESPEALRNIEKQIVDSVTEYGGDAKAFFQEFGSSEFLRNATVQRMMIDAAKYKLAQKAKAVATPRAVPPVQRPGVASIRGSSRGDVSSLAQRLQSSGSVDDAVALLQARRGAGR